jgi:hypothetical protein
MIQKWLAVASIFTGLTAGPGNADVIHTFSNASGPSTTDLDFRVASTLSLSEAVGPVLSASGVIASGFPSGSGLSFQDALFWRFIFLPGVDVWLSGQL